MQSMFTKTTASQSTLAVAAAFVMMSTVAFAAQDPASLYNRIDPTQENQTVVLTGHDLTPDQVIQVARFIQSTKATGSHPPGLPAPGELDQAQHIK